MYRREFIKIVIPIVAVGPHILLSYDQPILSYGVIADPQYADQDTRGTRFYRASLGKLQMAVDDLNKENLDFVVTLGDVIDKNLASFADILPIYKKLKAPHHLVLGNHDFDVADEDKDKVMDKLGMAKNYYSEVKSGWRFIYLDGTEVSLFRYAEGSENKKNAQIKLDELKEKKAPQAQAWNGGISDAQMKWFKQELKSAKAKNEKVVICNHWPVLPEGDVHNLWNAKELVSIIDPYDNVILYMNGHNHKGNYTTQNGTHYVNFKGMVETEKDTAYATVDCYADRVEIKGYGLEPDRIAK
ncbi:metallophosphoesterase [Portibacter lacus]|uniref:Phosphatase n=1 Tax=Portibacter lacus TaxID=1099794 RepID=A0AA37SU50_9BACT|nr:metallophosphoesterase [Portibacter lacus]GLR18816.1 phosphatase [Portibacter lacus]